MLLTVIIMVFHWSGPAPEIAPLPAGPGALLGTAPADVASTPGPPVPGPSANCPSDRRDGLACDHPDLTPASRRAAALARRTTPREAERAEAALAARLEGGRADLYGEDGAAALARALGAPSRTRYHHERGVTVPA
jgi:hypothetical protein